MYISHNRDNRRLSTPPKTLIIGADGFIGRRLLGTYRFFYPDSIGTSHAGTGGMPVLDLLRPDISRLSLIKNGYTDAVITSGITRISRCEQKPHATRAVNVEGTLELARQLSEQGLKVTWFSSDYVFDGRSGGYNDSSPQNPLNAYGKQKAEVEKRLPAICGGNYLIVRLSKLFSLEKGDGSLLDNVARKLSCGEKVRVAYDQRFCPTLVDDVIRALLELQIKSVTGLINFCNPQAWSRLDLVRCIAATLKVNADLVDPVSLEDLNEDFERPKQTSMVCFMVNKILSTPTTPIEECVAHAARNYERDIRQITR
jgi:dTDP-4-dehydrorhamnose reductase